MSASEDEFGNNDLDDTELLEAVVAAEAPFLADSIQEPVSKRPRLVGPGRVQPRAVDVPGTSPGLPLHGYGSKSNGSASIASQEVSGSWHDAGYNRPAQRQIRTSQTNLKQTTLFGLQSSSLTPNTQQDYRHNWPLASKDEPATHHQLDYDELPTWIYPTNIGSIRDYQFNIVARGLYHNLLVALPTGLGKTFIAATIMLNWYRWTTTSQIVFVAPTRPLVSQQVDACFQIAGIPRSSTTMLTGGIAPGIRAEEWSNKRVFFMTPQTIINDLKSGICDPKRIVLLVVDEAHRATGAYAYVEVVKFMRRFNPSFRVLALTATPGSTVESVQEVIDGLGISRVEIRTEESLDIREYVHQRKIETTLFEYSEELVMCMDLFSKALQPLVNKVKGMNAYWSHNPMTLTAYGCTQARLKWMNSEAGQRANWGIKGMVNAVFSILASLAHAIELLKFHGIGPFYHKLVAFRSETLDSGEKGSKHKREIIDSAPFRTLTSRIQTWISDRDFVGHPKLEALQSIALNHFMDAGEGCHLGSQEISPARTRIMIFAHFRDSAEEIVRVLKRNEPMIRPHVFVGQANSKGSEGMDQKTQLLVIDQFRRGIYNTLVATSIGEEGLDIGEVDLIVCYDGSASPIRMLQRMGRTGRKRSGQIEVLLMKDKEHDNFLKAKDNYEKMQEMIASGKRFTFHEELSPRIVPREVQPIVEKRIVEIPVENTQAELPEPKRRARAPKRPPKKFHLPDNARLGFTTASKLSHGDATQNSSPQRPPKRSPTPESIPLNRDVFLNKSKTLELEKIYQSISGEETQVVEHPKLDAHPHAQRTARPTAWISHGEKTKVMLAMLNAIHNLNDTFASTSHFEDNLHPDDRLLVDAQCQDKASSPVFQENINHSGTYSEKEMPHDSIFLSQSDGGDTHDVHDDYYASDLADFIDDGASSCHHENSSSSASSPVLLSSKPPAQPISSVVLPLASQGSSAPDLGTILNRRIDSESEVETRGPAPRRRRAVVDSDDDD